MSKSEIMINQNEDIQLYIQEIDKLGFAKSMFLNSSDVAKVIGVSESTLDNWRKQAIGIDYIIVGQRRYKYLKTKVAEYLARSNVKTVW